MAKAKRKVEDSSVLIAVLLGPGKEYTAPFVQEVVRRLKGPNDKILYVFDNVEMEAFNIRASEGEVVVFNDKEQRTDNMLQNIAIGRENARQFFLETDCTHLLFVDSDTIAQRSDLDVLLRTQSPMATGIYPFRGLTTAGMPCILDWESWEGGMIVNSPIINSPLRMFTALAYGFGFFLIQREVCEKVPFRVDNDFWSRSEFGEDYQYCFDVTSELGHEVIVNTEASVWHVHDDGKSYRIKVKELADAAIWLGDPWQVSIKEFGFERGVPKHGLSQDQLQMLKEVPGIIIATIRQTGLDVVGWKEAMK